MKFSVLIAALLLVSTSALADVNKVRVIGGSGANAREAKQDALKTASAYCKKKFGTTATAVDWTVHPMSSKELYMLLVDYTCGEKKPAK